MNLAFRATVFVLSALAPGAFVLTAAHAVDGGIDLNWERVTAIGLLGAFAALVVRGTIVPSIYYSDAKSQTAKALLELAEQRETARQAIMATQKVADLMERLVAIEKQIFTAVAENKVRYEDIKTQITEHRRQARNNWKLLERIANDCRIVPIGGDEENGEAEQDVKQQRRD